MEDLLNRLPAIIYEYTISPKGDRGFTYVSPSCERILGVKAEEIIKDASLMDNLVHKDDLGVLHATSYESHESASDWYWEGRMYFNGEQRWVEVSSCHEKKEDGAIVRRGIIQDITRRRYSAKESEIRYQSIIKRLPIGIVVVSEQTLVYANDTAAKILGRPVNRALIGIALTELVVAEQQDTLLGRVNAVMEGDTVPAVEQRYIKGDGSEVFVEELVFPFFFNNEKAVQVIFRDISEKKVNEARIKKNETLFTRLFNSIPLATVMLDGAGKVQQINKGFEDMFGFFLHELKNKNLNDFIVPEELRNEGIDLNNLITASRIISVVTTRRHRQGRLVNVILYGVPVMQDNETIGVFGVYVDITERMKVEEELKIRNTELDNFVYKVSHDLRAPLSSILGIVNLARLPGTLDDYKEYISIIGEKVNHLDHFISDVLSHSKNLKMDLSIDKVDLHQVIEKTFLDLDYLEGAGELKRRIKIEGGEFYSDPWRIMEIARNLISNTIKYRCKIKYREPEIVIKAHVDNLRAEIIFMDNGIGIEEDRVKKIFNMFYRATDQSNGSGIGLYIVKNAIEKLGGQITVVSKIGEGTRFNIILPNRVSRAIQAPFSVTVD